MFFPARVRNVSSVQEVESRLVWMNTTKHLFSWPIHKTCETPEMKGKGILWEAFKLYLESHVLGETDTRLKKKKVLA